MRYRPVVGRIAVVLGTATLVSGASCAPKLNARQELRTEDRQLFVEGREMEVFKVSDVR